MARTLADRRREEAASRGSVSQQTPLAQQNGGNGNRGCGRPPNPKISSSSTLTVASTDTSTAATPPDSRSVISSPTSQQTIKDTNDFDIEDVIRRLAHDNPNVAEAAFKEATTHRHGIINKPDDNASLRFWFMYLFLDLHIYGLSLENCLQRFSLPSLEGRGRDTLTDRKLTCIKKIRKVWPSNFRIQLITKGVRLPLEPYDGILSKLVMIAVREDLTIDEFAYEFLEWLPTDLLTRNEGKGSAQALASWNSGERYITNIDLENYLLFRGEEARKQRVEGQTAQGTLRRRGGSAAQAQVPSQKRGASSPLSHPSRRLRLSSTPVVEELSPRIAEEMDRDIDDMVSDSEVTFVSPRQPMQHSATSHSPVQPTLELQVSADYQTASLPCRQANFTPSTHIPEKVRKPSPQVVIPSRATVPRGAGPIEYPSITVTQTLSAISPNATASSTPFPEVQVISNKPFCAAPTAAMIAPPSNVDFPSPSPSSSISGPPAPLNIASPYAKYLRTLEIEGYPCFQCGRRNCSAHSLYNHNQAPCMVTPRKPVFRVGYKATPSCGTLTPSPTEHQHVSPYPPIERLGTQSPILNMQAHPPYPCMDRGSTPVPGQTQAAPRPPQNDLSAPQVDTSSYAVNSASVNTKQLPLSSTQSFTPALGHTCGRGCSPRVSTPRSPIARGTTATRAGNRSSVLHQPISAITTSSSTPRPRQVLPTITPRPMGTQPVQISSGNAGDRHSLVAAIREDDDINAPTISVRRVSIATPVINPGMSDFAATAPPSHISRTHSTPNLVRPSSPSCSSTLSSQQHEPSDPSEIQTYLDRLPTLQERKNALRDARTSLSIANEKVANTRSAMSTDINPITINLAKAVRARSRYENYLAECEAEEDAAGAQANRDLIIAHTHKIAGLKNEKAKAEKALENTLKAQKEVQVAKQRLEHAIKEERKTFDTLAAAAAEVRKLEAAAQKEKKRLTGLIKMIDRQSVKGQMFLRKWGDVQKEEN